MFEVKEIIRDVDRSPYDKRYLAFLGERLLSVYLKANNKNVFYCKLNKLDESIVIKIGRKILPRKLRDAIKNTKIYKKHFNARSLSSYKS